MYLNLTQGFTLGYGLKVGLSALAMNACCFGTFDSTF